MYTRRRATIKGPMTNRNLAIKLQREEKDALFASKLQRRYNRVPHTRRANIQTRQQMAAKKRQEIANLVLARRIQAKINRESKMKQIPRSKTRYNKESNHQYAEKLEQEFLNENYARQLTVHPEGYEESKMSDPPYRNLTLGKSTAHRSKPSHLTRIHF